MSSTLGYGQRRLVNEIVKNTWKVQDPSTVKLSVNDFLYVLQEMQDQEGKKHLEGGRNIMRGHNVFRNFAQHLLYRNVANYDSMVLLTVTRVLVRAVLQ